MPNRSLSSFALVGALLCACGSAESRGVISGDGGVNDSHDGGSDAGLDAGSDAGPDAGLDAGSDAGSDAGIDGGSDGGSCDAGTVTYEDWPVYRHDPSGTGRSNEPLTVHAAANFAAGWTFTNNGHLGYNYANPIVEGNSVWLSSGFGYLWKIDATTGAGLGYAPAYTPHYYDCSGTLQGTKGPVGAPAIVGDRIFMPSGSGSIDAYDKNNFGMNATPIWSTKIADPLQNEFIFSSAFPAHGNLYIGIASIFDCNQVVPGRVVGLDQQTGAVIGTWWGAAVPDPTNHGAGAPVWSSPSFDPVLDRIFLTTGTIANGLTQAQQPLAQAFVAMSPYPTTGADGQPELKSLDWYSPVTSSFAQDLEFGASPLLFDTADGRHLIAAATKGGIFYVADRTNLAGGVLWKAQIAGSGFNPDQGQGSIVSATLSGDGKTLYVGGGTTADGQHPGGVYAFDAATGTPRWSTYTDGFVLAALASAGDLVFAGATRNDPTNSYPVAGTIYALDARDGSIVYQLGGFKGFFGEFTYSHGHLYAGELGAASNGYGRLIQLTAGPPCP